MKKITSSKTIKINAFFLIHSSYTESYLVNSVTTALADIIKSFFSTHPSLVYDTYRFFLNYNFIFDTEQVKFAKNSRKPKTLIAQNEVDRRLIEQASSFFTQVETYLESCSDTKDATAPILGLINTVKVFNIKIAPYFKRIVATKGTLLPALNERNRDYYENLILKCCTEVETQLPKSTTIMPTAEPRIIRITAKSSKTLLTPPIQEPSSGVGVLPVIHLLVNITEKEYVALCRAKEALSEERKEEDATTPAKPTKPKKKKEEKADKKPESTIVPVPEPEPEPEIELEPESGAVNENVATTPIMPPAPVPPTPTPAPTPASIPVPETVLPTPKKSNILKSISNLVKNP